jgi:hypothetical protein
MASEHNTAPNETPSRNIEGMLATAGDHERSPIEAERTAGLQRLEGELAAFEADFESLVARVTTGDDPPDWASRGRALLGMTEKSLGNGRIEQGWQYLHAAKRFSFYGIEALDGGGEALRSEARQLLVEAENAGMAWRTAAIRERLSNDDGSLRQSLSADDLRAAQELLHDGYQRMHLKRQHLQAQFRHLQLCAALSIVLLLVVAVVSIVPDGPLDVVPSPLLNFSGTEAQHSVFLLYVVLAGILGGSLFGLRSLRRHAVSGSTPQYLTARRAAVARVIVGAGSAVAVFFFLRSELLTIGGATGTDSGPFLIAMGFVAGYSERLVHTTVESVADVRETDSTVPG